MIELRFYRERYNMNPDYYLGDKDIYCRLYFKNIYELRKKWKMLFEVNGNCLAGETYSAWDKYGDVLCGGAFDPDDITIITEYVRKGRKK